MEENLLPNYPRRFTSDNMKKISSLKQDISPKYAPVQHSFQETRNPTIFMNAIREKNFLNLFYYDFDVGNEFQKYYVLGNIQMVLKRILENKIKISKETLLNLKNIFKKSRERLDKKKNLSDNTL